ncbi:MAG TPA: hypothetical protein VKZ85_15040 [Woeseiaceae bacterium]|nr:hypothetical protein [Woeseiaceae bacterium]
MKDALHHGCGAAAPRLSARAPFATVALVLAACSGGDGVSIGDGQEPDPVVIDFPIAYVKGPLPVDGQGVPDFPDPREQLRFNVGTDLWYRDRASPSAAAINVTERVTQGLGDVRDVEISYDGTKLLFAMRGPVNENLALDDPDQPTWNIWEYEIATDELRRVIASDITAEIGHDIAPHYLPDGRIIFSSTRQLRSKAVLLDEGKPQFDALDETRNEPAFLLHVMQPDGTGIEQVSFNQSHDMDPAVTADGRIVFSRWDAAGQNDSVNLYRMNPDGSGLELLYGRNSHATGTNGATVQFLAPRELEDGRILALVRPYQGTQGGGDIVMIDTPVYVENTQPNRDNPGLSGPAQVPGTVNEVSTAPATPSRGGRYASAYPIHDGTGRLLVTWSQCRVVEGTLLVPCTDERLADPAVELAPPIYGVWIYDPRDRTQLPVVPPEEGFVYTEAVVADPRPAPPVVLDGEHAFALDPDLAAEGAGVISIRSVYDFDGGAVADIAGLADPAQTTADERPARFLRVVKAVSIPDEDVVDLDNTAFGRSTQQGMREIVGYAPIEPDGSVMMKVPANVALAVSVLDASGRRITARHQNWLQVRPGQILKCNGCHVPNSGVSHGRGDAFVPAWAGAEVAGVPFPNTDPALFVGEVGETMAEVRARLSCATDCASIQPSVNLVYEDVWTDEAAAGRAKDASFALSYADLTTPAPTSAACMQQWTPGCRIVINYETHIHPLWSAPRPELDAMGNPVLDDEGMPITRDCVNCHSPVDDQMAPRVPAGQLDLSDGFSVDEPDHFTSYRELLFPDNEQELNMGALQDVLVQVGTDPETGDPIFVTRTVNPSMSVAGALASSRFFAPFEAGGTHEGWLTPAELRLIAEWLDVGAQYYNNPFDVPAN